jgi:hypothetical protein
MNFAGGGNLCRFATGSRGVVSGEPEQLHCTGVGAGTDRVARLRRRLAMHIELFDEVFFSAGQERSLCVGHREPAGDATQASWEGGRRVEARGTRKEKRVVDGIGFQRKPKSVAGEIDPGDVESFNEPGR